MTTPQAFLCPITLSIMKDPYSDSDGNSYEKEAIFNWVNIHHTSPITRNPLTIDSLVPNRALKDLIDNYLGIIHTKETYDHIDLDRLPLNIIMVADVSGSMSEICRDKHITESINYTRLDLVKHTMRTIIESLTHHDKLSIIKFNNSAEILTGLIKVSKDNKSIFNEKVDSMIADGGTNIWDALRIASNLANKEHINDKIHILLFTDGESNENPPRGIIPTFNDHLSKFTNLNINIHTYGFGNNINSPLLYEISEIIKGGLFGFIPDSSMIGTVFINSLAYLMSNNKQNTLNDIEEQYRILLIESLKKCDIIPFLTQCVNIDNSEFIRNILIDCQDTSDENNGQIFKALIPKYYDKWGKHYIYSVMSAYTNKCCLNFKDHGIQYFKNSEFNKFQKEIEDIFINLSPPTPTGNNNHNYNHTHNNQQPMTSQVFSSTYYNNRSVCFLTNTKIKLQNGLFIPVQNITKGMKFESMGHISTVLCVLKTKFSGRVRRHIKKPTTALTPYHPIFYTEWIFPNDSEDFTNDIIKDDYVYNYILDNHHIVELEGSVYATTLNHSRTGKVISHPYFGTGRIMLDLMNHPGWINGFIQLDEYKFIIGQNGLVDGLLF